MSTEERRRGLQWAKSAGGQPDKGYVPVWAMATAILTFSLSLWLADFQGPHLVQELVDGRLPIGKPFDMVNYRQFKLRYSPRYSDGGSASRTELSWRHLLFIADLASMAKHNLAYVLGLSSQMVVQSPFKAEQSAREEADLMAQLSQFNLTDNRGLEDNRICLDSPVSVSASSLVELSNPINGWLTRKTKKSSHFEVPNYPLDQQPEGSAGVTHIDADLRDCAGDIHDQSGCGACYAFSWLSMVGWHYCRQSGDKSVHFSEQHMIDCGRRARLSGCQDGLLTSARAFSQTFGTFMAADYPYKGTESGCRELEGPMRLKAIDFTRLVVDRAEWERVLEEQPILVEAHLPRDFKRYQRGIHPGNNCWKGMAHGMLLVGHGRQEGHPYWLLKNSMGRDWGENGYFRLSREAPMAQCFRTGFISKFKFDKLDQAGYDRLYDQFQFKPSEHKLGAE